MKRYIFKCVYVCENVIYKKYLKFRYTHIVLRADFLNGCCLDKIAKKIAKLNISCFRYVI